MNLRPSRWPVATFVLVVAALAFGAALFLSPAAPASSQAGATRTPSRTPSATPTALVPGQATAISVPAIGAATATRAISRLASPTPTPTEFVEPPLLTLTAFNSMFMATYSAIPTVTPGPSEITLSGQPHYIKFYADWCVPCRQMKPAVEAMKAKYGAELTFWEINIDNLGSRPLVIDYRVEAIPLTVLLRADGRLFGRLEGLHTEAELDRAITALLAAKN